MCKLLNCPSYVVNDMQALLESERQRADESERKYAVAQETIKTMKLEETERQVLQL